jgi:hypothetical protein
VVDHLTNLIALNILHYENDLSFRNQSVTRRPSMQRKISAAMLSMVLCTSMIGGAFATAAAKPTAHKPGSHLIASAKPKKAELAQSKKPAIFKHAKRKKK